MAADEEKDETESKPPPKRGSTRSSKKSDEVPPDEAKGADEAEGADEAKTEKKKKSGDSEVIHAAPSAPDLDAIPVHSEPDDVSDAPRVDAMGQDKRRQVVGQTYGPTKGRQATVFLGALAVIVALFIAGSIAVDKLDKPPKDNPASAPWSKPDSPQTPPRLPE